MMGRQVTDERVVDIRHEVGDKVIFFCGVRTTHPT